MLTWYIGAQRGFDRSVGFLGRELQTHLEPKIWYDFEHTYSGPAYEETFESLLVMYQLFRKTATVVGQHFGYRYPATDGEGAFAFLQHVHALLSDARAIF